MKNFKNKTKPPGATCSGSSMSAEVTGPGPAPHRPPARSSYICIAASQRKLNVSGASMCAQLEGTLASQDKGRRFGVWEAQTAQAQRREGLTPHIDAAVGTQLLQGVVES